MRYLETVEDKDGKLAAGATAFMALVSILCIVILYNTFQNRPADVAIGAAVTIVGGVYGVKKIYDSSEVKAQIKADSPQLPPPDPVIPSPVTINTGQLPETVIPAKDVKIKADSVSVQKGGVNVPEFTD